MPLALLVSKALRVTVAPIGAYNRHRIGRKRSPIIAAILAMPRSLGLQVVTEDVENPSQRRYLQQSGCDIVQGYLFSPPLASDDFMVYAISIAAGNQVRARTPSSVSNLVPNRRVRGGASSGNMR